MSTKKIVVVVCDGCGTTSLSPSLTLMDVINLEYPSDSVVTARRQAGYRGWVHDKIGRDMCPDCRTFKPRKKTAPVEPPSPWDGGHV